MADFGPIGGGDTRWAILSNFTPRRCRTLYSHSLCRSTERGTGEATDMRSTTNPTAMLGRHSRVQTTDGTISGTILAVGAKGISIAVDRQVVRVLPGDIHAIDSV